MKLGKEHHRQKEQLVQSLQGRKMLDMFGEHKGQCGWSIANRGRVAWHEVREVGRVQI